MKELFTFKIGDTGIFLQKPGSQATRKMGTVYSVSFSNALKMGIMSEIDIRNHVVQDKDEREKLLKKWSQLENKRQMMLVKELDPKKIEEKLTEVAAQLDRLTNVINKAIVDNSAEVMGYQKVVDWMVVNLTFWDDSKLPVFDGETDDAKMNQYFDALDEGGLVAKVIAKAIICFQGYLINGITDPEIYRQVLEELDDEEKVDRDIPRADEV